MQKWLGWRHEQTHTEDDGHTCRLFVFIRIYVCLPIRYWADADPGSQTIRAAKGIHIVANFY